MKLHKSIHLSNLLKRQQTDKNDSNSESSIKWRALSAMALIYFIVFFNLTWAWGIFFLLIVIPDLLSGTTHFIEEVSKRTHPKTYWFIMLTWILLSLLMFLTLFIDFSQYTF